MNGSNSPTGCQCWSWLRSDIALVLAFALVCGALGFARLEENKQRQRVHPTISLDEMQRHMEKRQFLILDARPITDFHRGHIPGALPLHPTDFRARYTKLLKGAPKDRLIIVYCENMHCGLADEIQQLLIDHGHMQVGVFRAGWDAWTGARLVTEHSR